MEFSSYIPVNTRVFAEWDGPLAFDVYLRLGPEKFTKIFNRGLPVEAERLQAYITKGIQNFHVLKEDRQRVTRMTRELLEDYLTNEDFTQSGAQTVLDQAAERVLDELLVTHKMDAETYAASTAVVKSYVSIAKTAPSLFPKILKLAKTKLDLFRHSIFTAVFSTLLGRGIKPNEPEFWFQAGLAGLLHDIGLAQMSSRLNEHDDSLTRDAKKLLARHPLNSAEVAKIEGFPEVVADAIRTHHEYWDGTGYPDGLERENIPLLGRIVAVTEQFTGLIHPPKDNLPLTPPLALIALRKSGKVDPKLIDAFAKLLKFEH